MLAKETTMSRTLILLFHPDLSRSRTNLAMASAAAALPGVEVVDMTAAAPNWLELSRNAEAEAARLLSAERIVLQFPLQWYSTPPLLKAWQDAVLTRMFYVAHETEGRRLEGTPLMIATTAGNTAESYTYGGRNLMSVVELLAPLKATAHRCGLVWADPFVVYRADKLSPEEVAAAATDYREALTRWIEATDRKAA
jgi:putative NADPH-quinone reductase